MQAPELLSIFVGHVSTVSGQIGPAVFFQLGMEIDRQSSPPEGSSDLVAAVGAQASPRRRRRHPLFFIVFVVFAWVEVTDETGEDKDAIVSRPSLPLSHVPVTVG